MLLNINSESSIDLLLNDVVIYLANKISNKTLLMECKTVISEIIYNIQKYAPKGSVEITTRDETLFVKAQDSGKGISNLNDAIKDGYSTSKTLGLGLGISYDPEIFKILPASIYVLVENPICAGGLTAILLNIILPGGYRQENVLPGITSAEEMD